MREFKEYKRLPMKERLLDLSSKKKKKIIELLESSTLFKSHGIVFISWIFKAVSLCNDEIPACKNFIENKYKDKFNGIEFVDLSYYEQE